MKVKEIRLNPEQRENFERFMALSDKYKKQLVLGRQWQ